MSTSALEKRKSIPVGSELRVLLNSDHISPGEVQSTLREKGIFVGNSDKLITVPLLSSSLLTPSDFHALVSSSIDRESRPKTKISGLDLVSDNADWMTPIKGLFDQDLDILSSLPSIEFSQTPDVVVDSANQRLTIPYEVIRKDFSKDWVERELSFGGAIIIERQGNYLKLDFASRHSSKETEAINRKITGKICKLLCAEKLVKSEEPKKITFSAFDNVERVRFFKRLTAGFSKELTLGSVNEIEISRDTKAPPLPDDPQISWMKQSVTRMKIDGTRLNDVFLISDEKYYPFYHVQQMDVTFNYGFGANSGTCRVGFSFSAASKTEAAKNEAELTMDFDRITHANQVNAESKKQISQQLERTVRSLVEREFDKTINERPSKAAA